MKDQVTAKYLIELEEKVNGLPEEDRDLGRKLTRALRADDYELDAHVRRFRRELDRRTSDIEQKLAKLRFLTEQLLPAYYADVWRYIIKHSSEYSYPVDYYRRPFRTVDRSAHMDTLIWKLFSLHGHASLGISPVELLTSKKNLAEHSIAGDIIAYEIDQHNAQVLEAIQQSIFGDNNTARLSRDLIKGMLMSHNRDMYVMLGQLLVAAKLQEGLRQSIVETMDEGCLEATVYLMGIIIEHDLTRYSSVVRAISVWTGIELEAGNKRLLTQLIRYMHEALTDTGRRTEWLTSENTDKLYLSIWATAVQEEQQLQGAVEEVMRTGAPYQKVTALRVLNDSENVLVKYAIAAANLGTSSTEVEAMIIANYPDTYDYGAVYKIQQKGVGNESEHQYIPALKDDKERGRQFELLMRMMQAAPKSEVIFSSGIFEGTEITYSADTVAQKILYLIAYDRDVYKVNLLLQHRELLGADTRGVLLENFVHELDQPVQREFVFSSLSDRSSYNREWALKRINQIQLTAEEVLRVEALLKLKTGTVRQAAIKRLMKLERPALKLTVSRLISSKNELLRLGALEILTVIKTKHPDQFSFFKNDHLKILQPTAKEQVLLDKLTVQETDVAQKGFGLYDPKQEFHLFKDGPIISPLSVHEFLSIPIPRFAEILTGLDALVHQHKDTSYEVEWFGSKDVYLVGAEIDRGNQYYREDPPSGIESLPLPQVWNAFFEEQNVTASELFQIRTVFSLQKPYDYYQKLCQIEAARSTSSSKWRKELFESLYPVRKLGECFEIHGKMRYTQQLPEIFTAFFEDLDKQPFFERISRVLNAMVEAVPEDMRTDQKGIYEYLAEPWLEWTEEAAEDDPSFSCYFALKYKLYTWRNFRYHHPSTEEINRAFSLGLIDKNECYKELLERKGSEYRHHLWYLTHPSASEKFSALREVTSEIVRRLLEVELTRGDLPTPASKLVVEIDRFEGVEYFVSILKALEGETLARGYFYSFDQQYTKRDVLSQLLKNGYPQKEESPEDLALLLKDFPVAPKRLLEAAMYAPQWTDLIADYLGWGGLKKATWYFHAHTSEVLSSEKETIIAQYSPITAEQFNDGAFDVHWFKEAYRELGQERFDLLYECAKYISTGSLHRRAQLFADAAMDKLDAEELKAKAQTKRNKEHLLAYSLLPMGTNVEQATLERYDFIQQFLTESKKFGAQRRTSEAKVAEIALMNLAEVSGYGDLTRMRWIMEARKMEAIQPYTKPAEVDGYCVHIEIDHNGRSHLRITKNDKELASIPAKIKKNDYVQELKEVNRELKNQYSRNRTELEKSMTSQTPFRKSELKRMFHNPIVAPLINTLVFQVGKRFGFLEETCLVQENGDRYELLETDQAVIAHCVNLHEYGIWTDFQRILFEKKVIQPFKQVFRELYLLNADEKADGYRSLRYAGHQLQPTKAIALFRGRFWTVHYEEGLQKVHHRENIIATVDAMADWFSPADIESPMIEHVAFFDRKTQKPLPLTEIPPILFSEAMRDVDLAVSIAHVGSVDPQASLTTIDMRKAIIRESLRLTRSDNVRLEGNFAHITGTIGEYGVHLGSGNVQKQAAGSIYIIPVHSQHRGRLFLPFLDEDPKTAEILSKILLLAHDETIKDPHILEQLQS